MAEEKLECDSYKSTNNLTSKSGESEVSSYSDGEAAKKIAYEKYIKAGTLFSGSVLIDSFKNIYVSDSNNNRVQKFMTS